MTTESCCSYRDHFGDPEICPCPEHPRDELHVYGFPVTREQLRESILKTIGTFLEGDPWIGGGADLAAADLVIEQVTWSVRHGLIGEVRRRALDLQNAPVPDDWTGSTVRTMNLVHAEYLTKMADHLESM